MERISASVVCRSTVERDGARVGEAAQPMVWVATGLPGKQVNDSGCHRGIGLAWVRSARVTLFHGRACAALPPLEGEELPSCSRSFASRFVPSRFVPALDIAMVDVRELACVRVHVCTRTAIARKLASAACVHSDSTGTHTRTPAVHAHAALRGPRARARAHSA